MKSSAELEAIRAKLKVEIGYSCAIDENDTKVVVRLSDDGVVAAKEVVKTLMEEIEKRNLANVKVTQLGSTAKIDGEPVVEVTAPGKEKVTYKNVDAAKAREIIAAIK